MFITSNSKYLLNDMNIFGTCSILLIKYEFTIISFRIWPLNRKRPHVKAQNSLLCIFLQMFNETWQASKPLFVWNMMYPCVYIYIFPAVWCCHCSIMAKLKTKGFLYIRSHNRAVQWIWFFQTLYKDCG